MKWRRRWHLAHAYPHDPCQTRVCSHSSDIHPKHPLQSGSSRYNYIFSLYWPNTRPMPNIDIVLAQYYANYVQTELFVLGRNWANDVMLLGGGSWQHMESNSYFYACLHARYIYQILKFRALVLKNYDKLLQTTCMMDRLRFHEEFHMWFWLHGRRHSSSWPNRDDVA